MFTRRPEEIDRARALCKRYEMIFVAELRRYQKSPISNAG